MNTELADPIYNFIRLDPEFRELFLDNPLIQEEIFRAKNLACLGLVKYFVPTATHTKFEHHLGTYHLIRKSRRFLSRFAEEEYSLLTIINFFSCFGYLPLGYCASEAVILAAREEAGFRKKLLADYLNPVLEAVRSHEKSFSTNLNFIIDGYLYKALNSWLGGWKLLRLGTDFASPHHSREQILYHLVNNKSKVKQAYFDYATVDYLQRDLFYTGGGKIHLPVNKIFQDHKQGILNPAYRLLVESMRSTLSTQVYAEPRHVTLETWVKHRLVTMLLEGTLELETMLEGTDYLLDEKLDLKHQFRRFETSTTILQEEYFINRNEIAKSDKIPRSRQEALALVSPEPPLASDGFILSANLHNLRVAYNQFIVIGYTLQQVSRLSFSRLLGAFHALTDLFPGSKIESGVHLNAYLHGYTRHLLSFICRREVSIAYDAVFVYLQTHFRSDGATFQQFQQKLTGWIGKIQKQGNLHHNILQSHNIGLKEYILDGKKLAFLLEYLLLGPVDREIKKDLVTYLQDFIHRLQTTDKQWPARKTYFLIYLHLLETRVIHAPRTIICPGVKIPGQEDLIEIDFILVDLQYRELSFYLTDTGRNRKAFEARLEKVKQITAGMEELFAEPAYTIHFIAAENFSCDYPGKYKILNLEEILRPAG